MNRDEGLVARYVTNRHFGRLLSLCIYVLSVLMIASFVARNAGITKAEIARIATHVGSFSAGGLLMQRPYYLDRIFEPDAGRAQALPAVVVQGIGLAEAHQLHEINLSPGFWAEDQLRMRFGEGLYPIRLERGRSSTLILFAAEEHPPPACKLLDQRPLVRLMKCP